MKLVSWLLDLLFPPRCMICHKLIEPNEKPVCGECLSHLPEFDGAAPKVRFADKVCIGFYYENTFREAFLRFKFHGREEYAEQYGRWLALRIRDKLPEEFDVISYVPVSRRRKAQRGYDQTERICRVVSQELQISMHTLLIKHRHTKPQSGIRQREQRAANASGAYRATNNEFIAGKRILLLDDIITTGATLSECCRVLTTAGAKRVCVAALATPREGEERETL